jgi:hypothetical protein
MAGLLVPVIGLILGVVLVVAGVSLGRRSGARISLGRRLAGAREHRVGDLQDLSPLPSRPVRVVGRIRCADPIVTARDDRLVALHRDVDVQLPDGSWRTIERLRMSRGFDLWDHDGSLPIDARQAAEPLVTLPHVWRGGYVISTLELPDAMRLLGGPQRAQLLVGAAAVAAGAVMALASLAWWLLEG